MTEWATTTEAAEQTSYTHEHLNWLARKGKITARKSGNAWLVELSSVREYEQRMKELGVQKHNPIREDYTQS